MFASLFLSIFNLIFGTKKGKPTDEDKLQKDISAQLKKQFAIEKKNKNNPNNTEVGKW